MKHIKTVMVLILLMVFSAAQAYQAIIFDCDGVLVDTEQLKFLAWQRTFADFNIELKESDYFPLVGKSSTAIAKVLKKQKSVFFNDEIVIAQKNKIYAHLQKQGVPKLDDAINFLKLAIAKKNQLGIKIALASSASHNEILENLRQLEINPADFDAILSGNDDLKHIRDPSGSNKPKPYIYQLAAQKLGVKPIDCLVFEDSNAGVIAATRAGMVVIAVPNTYTSKHDFSLAMRTATFKEIDLNEIIRAKIKKRFV